MVIWDYGIRFSSGTDGDFRLWGSLISARMAQVGWVQTADTGQVDWATATKPATGNVFPHYEMWRFADALQATAPVFIKVEYGSIGGSSRPALRYTVGTATNGAGAFVGITSAAQITTTNDEDSAATSRMVTIGGTNRLAFCARHLIDPGGYSSWFFSIERTKDASGTDTAEGVLLLTSYRAYDYQTFQQFYWFTGTSGLEDSWNTALFCPGSEAQIDAYVGPHYTDALVGLLFFSRQGELSQVSWNVVVLHKALTPATGYALVTLPVRGVSGTFISIPVGQLWVRGGYVFFGGAVYNYGAPRLLLRYE